MKLFPGGRMICFSRTTTLYILLGFLALIVASSVFASDRRAYQHGVKLLKRADGEYWLLWSSAAGEPPKGARNPVLANGLRCEYFTHDIYYSAINPDHPRINKKTLLAMPEAQEPVSAAVSTSGNILITYEDGSESDVTEQCNGVIQQRYQLYDGNLAALSGMNTVATNGGHSGHVAAAGDVFTIAYAEGWIDGAGDDDAGTANDIHIDVVDARGRAVYHRALTLDNGNPRDWWPLIAASDHEAMLVWQRFVPGSRYANLMYSVYNPYTNQLIREIALLESDILYYHYDVQYLAAINRFLITGTYFGNLILHKGNHNTPAKTTKAFAVLLDTGGRVVDRWEARAPCAECGSYHTYTFVREAQPAIRQYGDHEQVLYPVKPGGWLLLTISAEKIGEARYIAGKHHWFSLGSDGVFLNEHRAFFVNLTPAGIKTINVDLD